MTKLLIPESFSKKITLDHEKNTGKWLIFDKYYFFQNQSNAKFIKKMRNTKKGENNSTPFQKEINLKLGKSNLFLMYFRLILSKRKNTKRKMMF